MADLANVWRLTSPTSYALMRLIPNSGLSMSSVKAALKVVLYADEVVVAESNDAQLWQRVLGVINGNPAAIGATQSLGGASGQDADDGVPDGDAVRVPKGAKGPLQKFASDLGISVEQAQAACDPQDAEPFMILDHEAWEAFKEQLGDRGPFAVSPVAAAGTLLALWFKSSGGSVNATQAQAQAVLRSINLRDSNPARGLKRTEWLQTRAGGQIILNPAKITKAKQFAKSFCSHDWKAWKAAGQ